MDKEKRLPKSVSKWCPYSAVKSHVSRVRALMLRIFIPQTPDISVWWKWFQNISNLKRVKKEKKPIWQDEGMDNRFAHAALVGSVLPDFVQFIMKEMNTFLQSKDAQDHLQKRFHINMDKIKIPDFQSDYDVLDFEAKCFEHFSVFLFEVMNVWRFLWNKEVQKQIQKNPKCRLALLATAVSVCDDNPIMNGNKKKFWKKGFERDKKGFWLWQILWGGSMTLATEFMDSLCKWEMLSWRVLSEKEIMDYAYRVHFGLLETMREFTWFTRVASHIRDLYERQTWEDVREAVVSWKVSYSAKFFRILEINFMKFDAILRKTNKPPKELWTMTCPAKLAVVDWKNVITLLCELVIIPALEKYYLPWRKNNIPDNTWTTGNPET